LNVQQLYYAEKHEEDYNCKKAMVGSIVSLRE